MCTFYASHLFKGSLQTFGPTENCNSENKSWPVSSMTLQDDNNWFPASFCWHTCRIIHIVHLEMELETSDWGGNTWTAHYRNFSHKTSKQESATPSSLSPLARPTVVTANQQAQRWGLSREGRPWGGCSTDQRIKHCRSDIFFKEEIKKSLLQTWWMGTQLGTSWPFPVWPTFWFGQWRACKHQSRFGFWLDHGTFF